MTAFVRTAAGDWSDPAKWDIGAGYPNALTDTADLASYAVTTDVDWTCGNVSLTSPGASLDIPTGRVVTQQGLLIVATGTTFSITGTLQAPLYQHCYLLLASTGATYIANAGAEFIRVTFDCQSGPWLLSNLIGDCSEANMATNMALTYGVAGTLTIDVDVSLAGVYTEGNGTITVNAGRTIKMTNGAVFYNFDGGKFIINGTRASPVHIQPRVPGETWSMLLCGGTTGSSISYLICSGNAWTFGDETNAFAFLRKPQDISPVHRIPLIDDDPILGRGKSRVHYKGNHAAIVEISGTWAAADKQYERVDTMMDTGVAVGFATDEVFIPNARILDHDYTRKPGRLYWPYTITLVEDV